MLSFRNSVAAIAASVALFTVLAPQASAQTYFWDPAKTGSQTWDTATTNWDSSVTATPTVFDDTWLNGTTNIASLSATASTTITTATPIILNRILFTGANANVIVAGDSTNTITLAGTSPTIDVITGGTGTISAVLDGTAGLTKSGAGILILSGANTYSGVTAVSAGTLNIQNNLGLGASGAGNGTTVANGTQLQLQGGIAITGETLSLTGGGTSIAGALLNLSGNNSWAGTINVDTSTVTRIASNAGTLTINGGIVTAGTAANGLVFQGDGAITVSGAISGNGLLTRSVSGTGILTLAGPNTYTGRTTISGGTVSVSSLNSVSGGMSSSSLGTPATAADAVITLGSNSATNAILRYTGTGETTDRDIGLSNDAGHAATIDQSSSTGLLKLNGKITNATGNVSAKTLTLQGSTAGTGEVSGVIENGTGGGATGVAKSGTGTWVLSGANTYTGSTSVNAGILRVLSNTALGSTTGSTFVNAGGQLQLQGGITITGETLTIVGDGLTSPNNGALRNISGNNTWTGTINVTTSANARIASNAGTLTLSGLVITSSATGLFVVQGDGRIEFTNVISGPATFTKSVTGTGTILLSAANTYTGGTSIASGTVLLGANAPNGAAGALGNSTATVALGSTATTGVDGGAALLTDGAYTIDRNVTAQTAASRLVMVGGNAPAASTFTGTITMVNATSLAQAVGGQVTFSGQLTGAGAVTVGTATSTGTVVITGTTNNYSVGTTVAFGTLLANNTAGSATGTGALTVSATGTLGGTGFIAPASGNSVTVSGTLAPGNSSGVGMLTVTTTGAGAVNVPGRYAFTLSTAGASADPLTNPGGSTISGAVHNSLAVIGTLNVNGMTAIAGASGSGFDQNQPYSWKIATGTSVTGTPGTVTGLSGDFASATGTFSLSADPTSVYLNYTPVPEPTTVFGLAALGLGFGSWIRRRLRPETIGE